MNTSFGRALADRGLQVPRDRRRMVPHGNQ